MPRFQCAINVEASEPFLLADLANLFNTHFCNCFYPDGSHNFIDYVIPPSKNNKHATVVLLWGVAPPNGFVEWRFPLYKAGTVKCLILNGNEYKCSMGETIT